MVFQFVFKLVATILSFDRVSALIAPTNKTEAKNTRSLFSNASPKPTTLDENDAFIIAIKVLVIFILLLPIIQYGFYCLYQKLRGKELTFKFYNNVFSFHAWIGVIIWSTYIIFYVKFKCKEHGEKTLDNIFIAAIIFVCFDYSFVIIASFRSNVMRYLNTQLREGNAEKYIRSLIAERPTAKTTVRCYHLELRSDGKFGSDLRRVYTWTGFDVFTGPWIDTSDVQAIPKASKGEIMRIRLFKRISFSNDENDETRRDFYRQRDQFIADNRHRDTNIEQKMSYDIADFKKHVMSYDVLQRLPFWMNKNCFILCIFLGLAWPFRWLFKYYTTKRCFAVRKEFFAFNDSSCQGYQTNGPCY